MRIPFTSYSIGKVENVSKRQPERVRVSNKVVRTQLIRTRQDISRWRSAVNIAESVHRPDRVELIRIYKDVILDAHLSSLMMTRVNKLLANNFFLFNQDGTINEDETDKLKSSWFEKFLKLSMDSIFYGYEVIQFGGIKDDGFESVEKIPEEYVVPELELVKKDLFIISKESGIFYKQPPYNRWALWVGSENYDFGLLNKATPLALWKKNVLGSWSEFAELFGMPIRMGKTDILDAERKANMEKMMESMGSAAWGVFDKEDIMEFVSTSQSDAFRVYDKLIERVNSEISKLILGQTMLSDDGSSKSQGEVHERVANDYTHADKMFLANIVNDKLIPFLKMHRIITADVVFKWDSTERLTILQNKEIIKELSQFYSFDPDEVSEKIGFKVEIKEGGLPVPEDNTVMNTVADLYKGYFDDKTCC